RRKRNIEAWKRSNKKLLTSHSNNISQHSFIEPDQTTYDAFIESNTMLEWNSDIDKFSFIRLFFYRMEGLINTEWDKEIEDGKTHIVIKFTSLNLMMKAIKRFNNTAIEVKSIMRLKSKRYFK